MKTFYLTTTLPYVNAAPHVGFALEIVQADILVRYWKSIGRDGFFTTGTDEHGQKLFEAAKKAGKTPQEYVDEYAAKFRLLKSELGLSDDLHFIRTTDDGHIVAAQEIWRRCLANGDIEKRSYKGLYCVGDEAFMKESDLIGGKCPNHPTMPLVELEEENYFFLLSKYQDYLTDYLSQEGVIVPEWRRQEALQFVERGLEDFSISRVKDKMPWGIPVPNDDSQVMYVWFDALTSYISTLGWPDETKEGNYNKFWVEGERYQMAGKDQVRFQSIMWQAMLKSAGLPATQHVLYHGFITSGGQKMSKSIGNVIDPIAIVEEYGVDALRYFLARHIHPFEDSDFTMERFKDAYNADLANGLGNLAARIMKLAETNLPEPITPWIEEVHKNTSLKVDEYMNRFEFNDAMSMIWSIVQAQDLKITISKPFSVIKTDQEQGITMIKELVNNLHLIAEKLLPFMPETAEKILTAIKENKKPENLFLRKE